jgi:uncharacterized phiE125 gp8 family phage protein
MLTVLLSTVLNGATVVTPTEPVVLGEPITVAELKQHLDIVRDDQDAMLAQMIVAGREWVENYTGLILTARDVQQGFDGFSSRMELYAWPVRGMPTVGYIDSDGEDATVPGVRIAANRRPARILPEFGVSWPSADGVTVTVPAGYANPADVPASLKSAIVIHAAAYYEARALSDATISALEALCHPYRLQIVG